jgi:ATP-dependent protease ClpP protease subunit
MENKNYKLDQKIRAKKTEDIVRTLHEFDVDLQSNHIYLMSTEFYSFGAEDPISEPGIDFTIANRFIRNLNLCMRVNHDKSILVHMKTCGGDWEEGMAIYDIIKSCPMPITILNYTHARSMSSIIFQAANKRVMMPNSSFMFHDGTFEIGGTVKSVNSTVDFYKLSTETMSNIYLTSVRESEKFKGKTDAQIKKWLRDQMDKKEDVYLTAKETVEYGFADEIFDFNWANLTDYTDKQLSR